MQKRMLFHQKHLFNVMAASFVIVFSLLMFGCDNSSAQKDPDDSAKAKAALLPAASINKNLPACFLTAKGFLDSIGKAKHKDKLVLQLYHQKGSDLLSLALYPAKKKNEEFDSVNVQHPIPFVQVYNIIDKDIFLGDQQTLPDDLAELVKNLNDNPARLHYVIFKPGINSKNNHLSYDIWGSEDQSVDRTSKTLDAKDLTKTLVTRVYTSNPSPPATVN